MNKDIKRYIPVAQAIEALLHPYAEIVLHDLKTLQIAALFNNFSKRKPGDESLLENEFLGHKLPDYFEPYYKTNWDGRKIKSTTATIRDAQGKPVGLLCINLDISNLDQIQQLINVFTEFGKPMSLPQELFSVDWREKISIFVNDYMKNNGKSLKSLSKEEKKALVHELHSQGAFNAKHAAAFVGDVLDISRATVYKYLGDVQPK